MPSSGRRLLPAPRRLWRVPGRCLGRSLPGAAALRSLIGLGLAAQESAEPAAAVPAFRAAPTASKLFALAGQDRDGAPTFTPSVPSGTRIFAIVPSSTASNSIVALSVSISARRSPAATASPSLTSHLVRVPCSIVGERAGILSSMGMGLVSVKRLARLKANAAGAVKWCGQSVGGGLHLSRV